MSRRIPAKVKPELLVWARESAHLSLQDAAKKLKMDASLLEGWESGDQPLPVILINSKDAPQGRIITLIHEFAHIETGAIKATEEVYLEVSKKDDALHAWFKYRKEIFVPVEEAVQVIVADILSHHPRLRTPPKITATTDNMRASSRA